MSCFCLFHQLFLNLVEARFTLSINVSCVLFLLPEKLTFAVVHRIGMVTSYEVFISVPMVVFWKEILAAWGSFRHEFIVLENLDLCFILFLEK